MIFPAIAPEASGDKKEMPIYREVKWNFEHNCPVFENGNPVIVDRAQAVVSWAVRALLTRRFSHEVYTWDYGAAIADLIGRPFSEELKQSEAARYVRECLMVNPYITEVCDISVTFEGATLKINCKITTVYGDTEVKI